MADQGILLPHALHQLLDLAATDLSGDIPEQCTLEQKASRVALLDECQIDAADPGSALRKNVDQPLALQGGHVTCPGERTAATRERNLREGVVVDEQIWQQCLDLAAGKMETKDISSACVLDNMQEEEKKK